MKRRVRQALERFRGSRYARPAVVFAFFFLASGALIFFIELPHNPQFGDVWDGIWWSFITFSTTGYGDKVPVTLAGRVIAILTIIVGIGAVSLLSGALASFLVERSTRARRGLMDFKNLRDHLIICGWREDMKAILQDIIRASDLEADRVVLVSNVEPEKVEELQDDPGLNGLKLVRGDYYSELALGRANIIAARKVVIISDTYESKSPSEVDAKTVMAVLTAKSLAKDVYVTAEVMDRKYESYLSHVQCDEVLFSRDFARQMLASSSATNGLSHIIMQLLHHEGSDSRLATLEIPSTFVNKTFGDYRRSFTGGGNKLLLGLLENTGSPNRMKMQALRDAQKTSDVSQLIANLQQVKGLEVNKPVLLPDDDRPIQRYSVAIVLERGA